MTKNNKNIFQLPVGFTKIAYSLIMGFAPANTVEAFRTSGFLGFEVCKGDVRITKDNVLIMSHNAAFTINDENKTILYYDKDNHTPIRDLTWKELSELRYNAHHEDFGYFATPCTIDDYLRVCNEWNMIPFITLRDEYISDVVRLTKEALTRWGFKEKCIINSFSKETLLEARKLLPYTWLHNVHKPGEIITMADYQFCKDNYPCILGLYNFTEQEKSAYDIPGFYEKIKHVIDACKEDSIPIMEAQIWSKKHLKKAIELGYQGGQCICISNPPNREFKFSVIKTTDRWDFVKNSFFEVSGTIDFKEGKLLIKCDDILGTWQKNMDCQVSASSKDTEIIYSKSIPEKLCYEVFPKNVSDGMIIHLTIKF